MEKVRLLVIYYSSTGANYQLARWAEEGASNAGAEVRLAKVKELAPQSAIDENPAWQKNAAETDDVPEVTLADLEWADAYIFSAPTRYGSVPAQLRQFLDTTGSLWFSGKLTNKVVSAMSSAMNDHGGQETTIMSIYTTMCHWGAIIAAPGYTDPTMFEAGGNPYGVSVSVEANGKIKEDAETVRRAVHHQAARTVMIAGKIVGAEEAEVVESGKR